MHQDLLLGWPLGSARRPAGFASEVPTASALDEPLTDSGESHCLVVAPTGAGKGRSIILPNLLHWPHTAIVVDVKGEAALATARYRRSIGQQVAILDPFQRVGKTCDRLNPLDWLGKSAEHLADNAVTLSEAVTGKEALSEKEPFWDHAANDFTSGLIARAATRLNPQERCMGAVYNLLSGEDPVYQIAVWMDTEKEMHAFARRQLGAFLHHEADKVRTSVMSVALQHMRAFSTPLVQAAVADTTIDLDALRAGKPMTIYLVMPANRLQSHAGLLWLNVLLGVVAERTSQPECTTLLVLDEMAQIGGVPLILQALTLLRGYGLRVMAVVQSLAQLQSLWKKDYQTVIDNCGVIAAFGQSRPVMANPMADLLGDLSAAAIMQMPPDQLAINRTGQGTVIARKLDYLRDAMFAGRFDANPLYERSPATGEAPAL
jgi:type IV secretion system protein VirD4